jgi:hypothetical protein
MNYDADERYQEILDTDSSEFAVVPADDVMDFSETWDLPSDVNAIVRVFDRKNCKVIERAYKTHSRARKFIESHLGNDDVEVSSFDNMTLTTNYQLI